MTERCQHSGSDSLPETRGFRARPASLTFSLPSALTWFWRWRLLFLGLTWSGLGNFFLLRCCCAGWLRGDDQGWLGDLLAGLPGSWSGDLFGFRCGRRGVPFLTLFFHGLAGWGLTAALLWGRLLPCWWGSLLTRVHRALHNSALSVLFLFSGLRLLLFLFHS